MADKKWHSYEEVACDLLDRFKDHLGLVGVERKQKLVGKISGRRIEIDGKALTRTGFAVLECKCYKDRVDAEKLEALAFRITDAGAEGGIVVSTMGLQDGAAKIAEGTGIVQVTLNADCNPEKYTLRFLNQMMIGVADRIELEDSVSVVVKTKTASGVVDEHLKLDDSQGKFVPDPKNRTAGS